MYYQLRLLLLTIAFLILLSCSKRHDDPKLEGLLCYFTSEGAYNTQLISVQPDGSNHKVVLKGNTANPQTNYVGYEQSKWSFDKKKIVFTSARGGSTGLGDIFIINQDGTGLLNITNTPNRHEISGSLSPDNKKLAFVTTDQNHNFQLFVADINGGGVKQLTQFATLTDSPTWSYDGKKIIFSYRDAEKLNICSVDIDGSNLKRITNSTTHDEFYPSITKDGKTIAFVSYINGSCNIYLINIDGSNKRLVGKNNGAAHPVISPDGNFIAFVGVKNQQSHSPDGDIHIIRRNGTQFKIITTSEGEKIHLDWK